MSRRRPMERIGDLIPGTARRLGLEEELRLARAISTWTAIVEERAPLAAGATRLIRLERDALVVEADAPIVAQELRMRQLDLLGAFATAPGGAPVGTLRIQVAPAGQSRRGERPRASDND